MVNFDLEKTVCQAEILEKLRAAGAHFVIVDLAKKRPRWEGWINRRPSVDNLIAAARAGLGVGIIPASLGYAVIDIDDGDPAALIKQTAPRFVLPTPRGCHLWFASGATPPPPNMNRRRVMGCVVDVIVNRKYVIIHGWRVAELAAGAAAGGGGNFPFSLFDDDRARTLYNAAREITYETPHNLRGLREGCRNVALFNVMRLWAYAEYATARLTSVDELLYYGMRHNELMAEPLPLAEVEKTAKSIFAYCEKKITARPGCVVSYPRFVEKQRMRAYASARARRELAEPKVCAASKLAAGGKSPAEIAAAVGVSVRTIYNWARVGTINKKTILKSRARELAAGGKSPAEIAAALGVSPATVYNWRKK